MRYWSRELQRALAVMVKDLPPSLTPAARAQIEEHFRKQLEQRNGTPPTAYLRALGLEE